MKIRYIPIIIGMIVLFSSGSHALRPADVAPDLLGRVISTGKIFKLNKFAGKINVVTFFSINCKYCKKALPEMAKMEKEFPTAMFIAIYTGKQSIENLKKFLSGLSGHPKMFVYAGSLGVSESPVQKLYGYRGLPHSVVIDTSHHIYKIIPGYKPDDIKTALKELSEK
ncbi:MAG: TlpA family protein disulfide reductase [Candidatus Magnetomorum sp.]|nr:TlpA family protein disulfide reductase [Candidatus Magnetomorum sp.]